MVWSGFTTRWYRQLLSSPDKLAAAGNTILLALVSTAVSTLLGTLLGYGMSRYRFPGKKFFSWLMYVPVVTIVVRSRLAGMDPTIEEAARDLGAGGWQTFRHVTLPLMAPGVVAGALLAFTLSLDDFVVSFFTAGPGSTTLP